MDKEERVKEAVEKLDTTLEELRQHEEERKKKQQDVSLTKKEKEERVKQAHEELKTLNIDIGIFVENILEKYVLSMKEESPEKNSLTQYIQWKLNQDTQSWSPKRRDLNKSLWAGERFKSPSWIDVELVESIVENDSSYQKIEASVLSYHGKFPIKSWLNAENLPEHVFRLISDIACAELAVKAGFHWSKYPPGTWYSFHNNSKNYPDDPGNSLEEDSSTNF